MTRTERLAPGGVPRYVRVYDNGGESADRYTVVFSGRSRHKTGGEFLYVGMSGAPYHPQGIGLHGSATYQIDAREGWPPALGRRCHLGTRIRFDELPEDCKRVVWDDYSELWEIPNPMSQEVEARRP